jgi:hypothetical protein
MPARPTRRGPHHEDRSERYLARALLVTQVKCKSGDAYVIPTFYVNFRLSKAGKFSRSFADNAVPSGDRHTTLNIQVKGATGRGVLHMTVVFAYNDGKQLDTCAVGR